MRLERLYQSINYFAALVWLVNGLYCKVLNNVPRHQQIVEEILNISDGRILTILIGFSEIIMAVWILSKLFPKLNVVTQASIVMLMNIIEQQWAGELLLWGQLNFIFALCFSLLILSNEFVIKGGLFAKQNLKETDV